jgi:hypothetical protein
MKEVPDVFQSAGGAPNLGNSHEFIVLECMSNVIESGGT